mgnify:CR=1 FL=1
MGHMNRCPWCECNEKMRRYHDEEWGVPLYDDQKQFEFLMMEVMQCGLNWNMMIQKRDIFGKCFNAFDFDKVAAYGGGDIERIMNTDGMIKSPRKIQAVFTMRGVFRRFARSLGLSVHIFGSLQTAEPIYIWGIKKAPYQQKTAYLILSVKI